MNPNAVMFYPDCCKILCKLTSFIFLPSMGLSEFFSFSKSNYHFFLMSVGVSAVYIEVNRICAWVHMHVCMREKETETKIEIETGSGSWFPH